MGIFFSNATTQYLTEIITFSFHMHGDEINVSVW